MPQFHSSVEMFDVEDLRLHTITHKAYQVITEDGRAIWIPKSQVESITRDGKAYSPVPLSDTLFAMRIPAWLAKEKGIL